MSGLAGILEQLDHFQYLNVKSVCIGSFYRSSMKDFGYNVEDFRAIDPVFGTMKDFEELLGEMHNKGVCLSVVRQVTPGQQAVFYSSSVPPPASSRFETDHGFHSQSYQ